VLRTAAWKKITGRIHEGINRRAPRLAAATSGCATIVSRSSQTITVTSVPDLAAVTISNSAGTPVHSGNTPMTVTLKKGRGYFKAEHYTLRFTKEGFQPREVIVSGEVTGWYFGTSSLVD
jgi:hypothetical protein